MILISRQIHEARALLGLYRSGLAAKVKTVTTAAIIRAESVDEDPPISAGQAAAIQRTFEAAGVEFIQDNGGAAGVRLRKST